MFVRFTLYSKNKRIWAILEFISFLRLQKKNKKKIFKAHSWDKVFLVFWALLDKKKKMYTLNLMVSFFATDSSFWENSQKSPSLQKSAIFSKICQLKSSKKKFKLQRKSFNCFF